MSKKPQKVSAAKSESANVWNPYSVTVVLVAVTVFVYLLFAIWSWGNNAPVASSSAPEEAQSEDHIGLFGDNAIITELPISSGVASLNDSLDLIIAENSSEFDWLIENHGSVLTSETEPTIPSGYAAFFSDLHKATPKSDSESEAPLADLLVSVTTKLGQIGFYIVDESVDISVDSELIFVSDTDGTQIRFLYNPEAGEARLFGVTGIYQEEAK